MQNDSIIIKIMPALNGDSILINALGKVILIDGGYVDTYNRYLKKELINISKEGKTLSHLIVTHIDEDHISGIIKFLEENNKKQFVSIENIWHNSYRHIQQFNTNDLKYELPKGHSLDSMKIGSYVKDNENYKNKDISAKQGSSLGALILKGKYKWNNEFENKAVSTDNLDTIKLSQEVTIRLLSPSNNKLEDLYRFWRKELYKMGFNQIYKSSEYFDDAFEFLIAQEKEKKTLKGKEISYEEIEIEMLSSIDFPEDTSVSNGSSISFVLEYGKVKLLFLADSHPSQIVNSLKKQYDEKSFPIKFNLIKISHHGCISNTSKELLQLIDSENYIFSTNGKIFNHPDVETIARIISRKVNFKRRLYFNYPLEVLNNLNTTELRNKYNFECQINDKNLPTEIEFYEKYN